MSFLKKALQASAFFQNKLRQKQPALWGRYASDARLLAEWFDLSTMELSSQQQHPERLNPEVSKRICNWYLPPFNYAYFGGILTILRLASHLNESAGIQNRFIIVGDVKTSSTLSQIKEAFPNLAGSEVIQAPGFNELEKIPTSDYSIATFWTTAYYLQKIQNTALKFYMVQDFEPLFYPAGSTFAQVEETYKFGFYGICNTETLKTKYEEYGSTASTLIPAVDREIFSPGNMPSGRVTKNLFFYARPDTPRNMFELVAPALIRAKKELGEKLHIVCAGGHWQPKDFGLAGIVEARGLLSYKETGDLYRESDIGLAFMMTPHPSYLPLELMASGSLVIANENVSNQWLLKDGENCLTTRSTVSCIAETIIYAVENFESLNFLRTNALKTIELQHNSWAKNLMKIEDFILSFG